MSLDRKPVNECSADELHRELVSDRVRGIHTPLKRFVDAIARIAEERNRPEERVYQDIRAEAKALGSQPSMFDA